MDKLLTKGFNLEFLDGNRPQQYCKNSFSDNSAARFNNMIFLSSW